ncbi:MAG TPA: hypothetical protein VFM76_01420 [Methylophaga sp.]|nr:hypothetical protein [Methylophaga sp.]
MSAKSTHSRRRSAIFVILILSTTFLSTFPPVFLWANTIEPRWLGLPFALIWHLSLALIAAIFFAGWYLADSRGGALDIDVTVEPKP